VARASSVVIGGCLVVLVGLTALRSVHPVTVEPPLLSDQLLVDAAAQDRWLKAGRVPQVAELGASTMVTGALLDLYALSQPAGVPVAGAAGPWRYVWPRDSALAAAALARTGHAVDAERIVSFWGQVQPASGVFAARYRPDGSGVPDDRGDQLDGTGWALWGTGRVTAELPEGERAGFVRRHRDLIDRSTATALAKVGRTGLPPASADYWEVREWRPTLATAALLNAGLESAAELYGVVGDPAAQASARAGAARLAAGIERFFRPSGYPRRLGGRASTVDLGVGFLLPPFRAETRPDVVRSWRRASVAMLRPAGGLAPGGSWRRDGISWTTATSSYALTAACLGDRAEAVHWLRWLDEHRTPAGSLPEKVTATGRPAAVAPLAWTAAAVILTAAELDPTHRP
jgi:glucoamylase